MKNTLQLKKQLRARRRKQSKRQTLSLEQLEPKQLLTTADSSDFEVSLTTPQSSTSIPLVAIHSYLAPFATGGDAQVQGKESKAQWTAALESTAINAVDASTRIIHTVQDFQDHLAAGQVAEVSDNLIGNFYNATDNALYPSTLQRAWAFSSDNLYTLLVLNSREPGQTLNEHGQLDPNGTYHIANRVMQAMMRVVGFGFTGDWASGGITGGGEYVNANGDPLPALGPVPGSGDVPFPNSFNLNLCVFDKHGTFETTNPAGDIVHSRGLDIQVPTVRRFFEFTNDPINGRGLTGIESPSVVQALPHEVYRRLESLYREAIPNNQNPQGKNSIEIFAEISGIDNLQKLLMYPNTVYRTTNPGSVPPNKGDAGGTVYDAYNVPLDAPFNTSAIISPNYATYKEACDAIRGYYQDSLDRTQLQVRNFFSNFANSRLKNIASGDNPDKNYDDLVIGFRALMALSYDASPFWTSYGIGFSNGANPLVGANLDAIQQPDRFIDLFNGQEIQLENISMPTGFLDIPALNGVPLPNIDTPPTSTFDNYTTDGWFALNSPTPITGVDNYYDPSSEIYQDSYEISTSGTAILFNSSSTSSDTVSAAGIPTEGVQVQPLQPDTLITLGSNPPVRLDSLDPVLVDTGSLPSNFATYISLAGGVDRVTGSGLDDVIVGSSKTATHGRLTVNAGAGHDVVAPGRGGSLVQLGAGADTVVFDIDDLFGEANFLDFNFREGDRIRLEAGIHSEWSSFNPDTITLRHRASGGKKVLRLTPMDVHGDNAWNKDSIAFSAPYEIEMNGTQGVTLDYVETHQFQVPETVTADSLQMQITASNGTFPASLLGFVISIRDQTYYYTKEKLQTGLTLNSFSNVSKINSSFQISVTPVDGNYNKQLQVFISRDKTPTDSENNYQLWTIQNGIINTPDVPNPIHMFATDGSPSYGTESNNYSPHTTWTTFQQNNGKYSVAYIGGLARILLQQHVSAKNIDIVLKNDFSNAFGYRAFNLSSRMAIWEDLSQADAEKIYQYQIAQLAGQNNLHAQIAKTPFDLKTLSTNKKIRVRGTGRIHTYDMHGHYLKDRYDIGSITTSDGTVSVKHENDPFYWINSDMLTASSTYTPTGATEAAIDISGITTAWALERGQSAMIFQDFNNTVDVIPTALWQGRKIAESSARFQTSPVFIDDYKHVGNWISQTDGPDVMGWGSKLTNSFLHVNDDAIKVRAAGFKASDITILQGNGGNPVGYGYGFINGTVANSTVDNVFIHRISHDGKSENNYGLVAMRIVPNPDWTYEKTLGPTHVTNLYVPTVSKDLSTSVVNSVGYHTTLNVSHKARGFGPSYDGTSPTFNFTVGNVFSDEGFKIAPQAIIQTDPKIGHTTKSYFQLGPFISNDDQYNQPKLDPSGSYQFEPFPFALETTSGVASDTIVIVSQAVLNKLKQPIQFKDAIQEKIVRPTLYRSSKIIIDGLNGVMGPSPLQLTYSHLVDASLHQSGGSAAPHTFVVSNVASGYVEKKRSDGSWVDVSTPITTSNPRALIQLLRNRMIAPGDEVRWVPGTANEGKASAQAFSLYGWDGVSASVEASEIEVGVE